LGVCTVVYFFLFAFPQVRLWKDTTVLLTHNLKFQPNSMFSHNNLGVSSFLKGKEQKAAYHFKEILRLDPDAGYIHLNLGTVYLKQGHVDRAITSFSKAVKSDPNSFMAHYNLGQALLRQGNLFTALIHFNRAHELEPKNRIVINRLRTLEGHSLQ